jgi:type IV pilus assembly protein PilB
MSGEEKPIQELISHDNSPVSVENAAADTEDNTLCDLWNPEENEKEQSLPALEKMMLERGLVSREQLQQVHDQNQNAPDSHIGRILVEMKLISEVDLLRCIADQYNLPFLRVRKDMLDPRAFKLLDKNFIEKHNVLPISFDANKLIVAITDPANIFLIDEIQRKVNMPLLLKLTPSKDIHNLLKTLEKESLEYNVDEITRKHDNLDIEFVENSEEDVSNLKRAASDSPIIKFVNYIIVRAVKDKASDIHVEPGETELIVRFRIDGILFDQMKCPQYMHPAIVSRIKIMSNLDIAERRLPQDGRIRMKIEKHKVDLRISVLPSSWGEKVVIRILDTGQKKLTLLDLGLDQDEFQMFRAQIKAPHGIILVTGPTGSGKSTTLYACLQEMDFQKTNIITVEDPIEYQLPRITQVQAFEKIGLTFASALRSFLRQDPDVIMVGEIRDEETARISIQASLTGHLVLSTLHTNDAPSSITRLVNIGIEPYLIAASLNAILAQRLVRRICDNCKTLYEPEPESMGYIKSYGYDCQEFYKGAGCDDCRDTGFQSRIGLFELLIVDDVYKDIITKNSTVTEIRRTCKERGMISLRDDGFRKVQAGLTTIKEVMRVTESTL